MSKKPKNTSKKFFSQWYDRENETWSNAQTAIAEITHLQELCDAGSYKENFWYWMEDTKWKYVFAGKNIINGEDAGTYKQCISFFLNLWKAKNVESEVQHCIMKFLQ